MEINSNTEARAERAQRILQALRAKDETTLTELTRVTKISRPTVGNIIADLEYYGIIAQRSTSTGAGRPAALYGFAPQHGFVVALDIQRDILSTTIASLAGDILHTTIIPLETLAREERLEAISQHVRQAVEVLRIQHGNPICGFASATGIIDGDGTVLRSYLVPQWHGINLAEELTRRCGFPFRVDNDINTAAYGEFMIRVADARLDALDGMLFFRLFAGFRTGFVLRGEVHHGHNWHAGEVNDRLDLDLRARTIPDDETSGWELRAATTIGTICSVIDPTLIVLSAAPETAPLLLLREHLATMRLPTAPRLRIEEAELGHAAASLGAVSLALRDAEKSFLRAAGPVPIAPKRIEDMLALHQDWESQHAAQSRRVAVDITEPLRIGVVGLGARSKLATHVETDQNGARIVAACDPDPAARIRCAELLGKDPETFPIVGSVRELIELGLGAAFVTSPDDTHSQVTAELLEAGIPVYLEKPMATTLESATRILTTAYETKTRLHIGHNTRHTPFIQQMRDLILEGAIGEVKTIWCRRFIGYNGDRHVKDWHADREHSNSLLLKKAADDLDAMRWLTGSTVRDVVGMGEPLVYEKTNEKDPRNGQVMTTSFSLENWPSEEQADLSDVTDAEDVSMLMARLESGALISYQQCHSTPDDWRNYTVIGTRGGMENFGNGGDGVIRLWGDRGPYDGRGNHEIAIRCDGEDADSLAVAEFLRFARTGTPANTSPLDAWQAVATAIQATESLRDGSTPRHIPSLPTKLVEYFTNHQKT